MRLELILPVRTKNPLNGSHGHWRPTASRRKKERQAAHLALKSFGRRLHGASLPLEIKLVRVKPRGRNLDSDAVPAALKAVRDGIADALGIDDGDELSAHWEYGQERGPWGVRIIILDGSIVPAPDRIEYAEEK